MEKYNDFKVGNYIMLQYTDYTEINNQTEIFERKYVVKIKDIIEDTLVVSDYPYSDMIWDNIDKDSNWIQPIKLSDEILGCISELVKTNDGFKFSKIKMELISLEEWGEKGCVCFSNTLICKIKYLHVLQNMYLDYSGLKLEVDEKDLKFDLTN